MNFKRIILTTIIVTVLSALYSMLTCGWLFSWVYMLEPTLVWIPKASMTGNFPLWVNLGNLVLYFFFVLIFTRLYESIPGACSICKGVCFGIFVWLLGILPGMFATHMFMTVNSTVVIYWAISGLIWLLIAGAITGLLSGFKKDPEAKCCCCS